MRASGSQGGWGLLSLLTWVGQLTGSKALSGVTDGSKAGSELGRRCLPRQGGRNQGDGRELRRTTSYLGKNSAWTHPECPPGHWCPRLEAREPTVPRVLVTQVVTKQGSFQSRSKGEPKEMLETKRATSAPVTRPCPGLSVGVSTRRRKSAVSSSSLPF